MVNNLIGTVFAIIWYGIKILMYRYEVISLIHLIISLIHFITKKRLFEANIALKI